VSWEYVKLGSLVELITKGTTPTSVGFNFTESGINFVKIESIDLNGKFIPNKLSKINSECNSSLKRSQLKDGDILFSIAGALGRTAIVTKDILPANTNQALAIIRLKDVNTISKEFLARVLASEGILNQLSEMKGGVAQQNLSLSQLKDFIIPLPPLSIQQKIVTKLDAIFAEIDKAKAAAEANAKNAEALFSQVLNNLENEYDGAVKELGECAELLSGFAFKSNEYSNGETDIPLLRGDNLNPKNIDFSVAKRFDRSRFDEYFKFSLATNDIVLGMDRPLISAGLRIAKVQSKDVPSLLVQRVMRLRCNKNVDSDFLFYLLNSTNFIKHLVGEQTGLGVPHVSGKTISSFLLKIPTIEIQRKIVTKLSAILESLNSYKLANKNILINWTLYKQAILTQAFNGELINE
jgi:type I restriction enzyme S subunit